MFKVTSDSTADLSALFGTRNIAVMPLNIVLGNDTYEDGVNVTPDDIYAFVAKTGILPKTAARNESEYYDFFTKALSDGAEGLIHFTISGDISASYASALKAAERLKNVYVVDSRSLSSGIGLLVLYAAELRDSGKYTAFEAFEKVSARVPFVQASFIVETMEYLYKGGRCSGLTSLIASVLKIKPSLLLKNGKIVVGKKFFGSTLKIADKYVENILSMYNNPDTKRVFITHTSASPEVVKIIKDTVLNHVPFAEVIETVASCTVTSHCGKGTIGILYINDGDKKE